MRDRLGQTAMVARFRRWMQRHRITLKELDEVKIQKFLGRTRSLRAGSAPRISDCSGGSVIKTAKIAGPKNFPPTCTGQCCCARGRAHSAILKRRGREPSQPRWTVQKP